MLTRHAAVATSAPASSAVAARPEDVLSAAAPAIPALLSGYNGLAANMGVRSFQTSSRTLDIDSAAKYIGAGAVFGSLIIGYARNPSLKQQLFSYAILGFALSE